MLILKSLGVGALWILGCFGVIFVIAFLAWLIDTIYKTTQSTLNTDPIVTVTILFTLAIFITTSLGYYLNQIEKQHRSNNKC